MHYIKYNQNIIRKIECESFAQQDSIKVSFSRSFIVCILFAIIIIFLFYMIHRNDELANNKQSKALPIMTDILSFLIPLGIIYLILTYIIMMSTCESGSMEPKLMTGNTVFYNRLAYVTSEPQRGDIIVFVSHEKDDILLGKRIIGLPGDKISFTNGNVIVNGKCIDESAYIPNTVKTYCQYEFNVPADCYFMLGDNRENSYDSRYWNNPYIEKNDLKGKYIGQIPFSFEWNIEKKFQKVMSYICTLSKISV